MFIIAIIIYLNYYIRNPLFPKPQNIRVQNGSGGGYLFRMTPFSQEKNIYTNSISRKVDFLITYLKSSCLPQNNFIRNLAWLVCILYVICLANFLTSYSFYPNWKRFLPTSPRNSVRAGVRG